MTEESLASSLSQCSYCVGLLLLNQAIFSTVPIIRSLYSIILKRLNNRGVPRNLKRRGAAIFDAQFTARNLVKTKKKGNHVFRRPIYRRKFRNQMKTKKKKVFTSFDVQFTARNQMKTKKKVFTFSAYISAVGERGHISAKT